MKAYLTFGDKTVELEGFLSRARTIVTIGRESDEAYNVIALADAETDVFQCQFTRTADGAWVLHDGQWRTECPKGIRSRLQHACSMCMGCCVNPRPAHPIYSWRMPHCPTLLNGLPLPQENVALHPGDTITFGNTEILYSET